MTAKKIIIIVLMIIALFVAIFVPVDFLPPVLPAGTNVMLVKIVEFLVMATSLLFWVGASTGWRFAENCGLMFWGRLIFAFIGIYLSLPIAIFQLIKPRYDC